jgi:hypothetical protein
MKNEKRKMDIGKCKLKNERENIEIGKRKD